MGIGFVCWPDPILWCNRIRVLLAQAIEAEVAALLAGHADKLIDDGPPAACAARASARPS
jgi:hypothetical protein